MPKDQIENNEEESLIEVQSGDVTEGSDAVDETEGMSDAEISRAKELGLIEDKDVVEVKQKDEEQKEEDEKEPKDPESFEEIDEAFNKNPDEAHKKYTKNAKGLYFKLKKEKNERQRLAIKIEEIQAEKDLEAFKESTSKAKLAKIKEALANPDELTIEKLNELIGEEVKEDKDTVSRKQIEAEQKIAKQEQEAFNQRVILAEQIGVSKYPNFKEIVDLAQEEANNDKLVQEALAKAFIDTSIDEEQLVERVVKIARMNDKFKDVAKVATPQEEENVKRAIKNSQKPKSSASLGGSGKVMKREDELTPEDVAGFTTKQILALSVKTRERLRRESSQ